MPILDPQDPRVNAGDLNSVNDPSPGMSLVSPSGSIVQPFYGQIGKRLVVNTPQALALSNTTVGTLFGGIYQYIQILLTATAAPVRGALCYWSDYENGIVTTDPVATNAARLAGWFISATANMTKGNYCFIQIAGKTSMLFKSTITKATPAIGDLVIADGATSPTVDILADATSITSPTLKLVAGVAITTPVNNSISLVDAWHLRQAFPGVGGF